MAQCVSDTLNAPADKLLLSQLRKLGGHSAISGRCASSSPLATFFAKHSLIRIFAKWIT